MYRTRSVHQATCIQPDGNENIKPGDTQSRVLMIAWNFYYHWLIADQLLSVLPAV